MQGRVNSVNLAVVTAATPIRLVASGIVVEYIAASCLFVGCAITGIIAITVAWVLTDFRRVESFLQSTGK